MRKSHMGAGSRDAPEAEQILIPINALAGDALG
jgi:hypothetical protein